MKTHFTRLLKNGAFAAFLLITGSVSAATYTAISSGAWSNASIWAGGVSPGSSISLLDNVVINAGATVTLDSDVQFSGLLTSLEVDGTLQSVSSDNYLLDMNSGVLSGTGTITLYKLRFGTTGTMTFSGTSSVDKLWNSSTTLNLVGQLSVNDSLFLDAGTFNLSTGGTLTFMSASVIRVDGGTMTASSGLLNNSNNYSVVYVGSNKTTGLELAGSGLTDVWVNLDDNTQILSIGGDVTIEGVLHHNQGMIGLNGASLTLMDDYMSQSGAIFIGSATSNLAIEGSSTLSSTLAFDASGADLNDLTINISDNNGNAHVSSNLSIHGSLMLEDGDFILTSGTLTMATGSEIVVTDGHMGNTGGSYDGTNAYDVTYTSTASTTSGLELTGSGLNDLAIEMDNASDSVQVMNTTTVNGELNLENGGMGLNGYDLVLEGSLATTSDGWLSGDDQSDLTFNTGTLDDTLWTSATANSFGTVTINSDDASDLMVGNNLHAANIMMSTGGLHIWDNEIWLDPTGSITGADANRYVLIDGSGSLVMNVQVSAPYAMYPVGTDGGYAPVGLQQNSGTTGYFKVNSVNGVWSNGLTGTNMALTGSVVDRTWDISSVSGGSLNLNLMTMWQSAFELNGFDRTDSYIMHYTGGSWDAASQTGSAAVTVGSMFQLERTNITSLSPFAVRDGAVTGIEENTEIVAGVYPNPVQDKLTCLMAFDETTSASVVDLKGTVLHTENVNGNHSIDFSAYPNGVYFVNYTNSKGTSSYRVIKSL